MIATKKHGEVLPQTFNQKLMGTYIIFVVFSSILRQELGLQTQRFWYFEHQSQKYIPRNLLIFEAQIAEMFPQRLK